MVRGEPPADHLSLCKTAGSGLSFPPLFASLCLHIPQSKL